jgi:phage tail tape-measure protein
VTEFEHLNHKGGQIEAAAGGAMLQTANEGIKTIPAQPAVGTTVTSGAANTFGSWVQMIASTSAAVYIVGVVLPVGSTETYVAVSLATGAAASETEVGQVVAAGAGITGVAQTFALGGWIPVASGARIAARTADSVGTQSHRITLLVVDQADVSPIS